MTHECVTAAAGGIGVRRGAMPVGERADPY